VPDCSPNSQLIKMEKGTKIHVKTLQGNALSMDVDLNEKVESLKKKVEAETGVPGDTQKLVFAGLLLEDGKMLKEYTLKEGSIVILVPKLEDSNKPDVELDLVFVVDCTGSMGSYIKTAQENIQMIVQEIIASESANVRFAIIMYRDYPPQDSSYITQIKEFTENIDEMKNYVNAMGASGGGDSPEAMATGLAKSLSLGYRSSATKVCVLIADAPPHGLEISASDGFPDGDPANDVDLIITSRQLAREGIRLYTVGCEPSISSFPACCSWMKWAAELCSGKYISLSSASLLSSVIIGGCREELNMDRLSKEVAIELAKLDAEYPPDSSIWKPENIEQVFILIAQRLNDRKITTIDLEYNTGVENPNTFKYVEVFPTAKDLKDAKAKIKGFTGSPPLSSGKKAEQASQKALCITVAIRPDHIKRIYQRKYALEEEHGKISDTDTKGKTCSLM